MTVKGYQIALLLSIFALCRPNEKEKQDRPPAKSKPVTSVPEPRTWNRTNEIQSFLKGELQTLTIRRSNGEGHFGAADADSSQVTIILADGKASLTESYMDMQHCQSFIKQEGSYTIDGIKILVNLGKGSQ